MSRQYQRLHFCYEAGLTGYGLHRQLTDLGHVRHVIAPMTIPKRCGDRVKTNRRDSVILLKLLRAGELRAIWAPVLCTRRRETSPGLARWQRLISRKSVNLAQRTLLTFEDKDVISFLSMTLQALSR